MIQEILSGKYKLLKLLGTGGSGSVYLARHQKLNDIRAIKCIKKSNLLPEWSLSEAKLLTKLNHPGIPVIYDLEEDDTSIYIIEEYLKGESLQTVLSESVFIPNLKKLDIIMQICEILEYLHGQRPNPVVYLDLKPEHIYLCGDTVRLVDFGIAAYLDSKKLKDMAGYGTPGFAAPEQYKGTSIGKESDIYALGAVAYWLLFGQVYKPGKWVPFCMGYGRYMRYFLQCTLAINEKKRFSSIEDAKAVLLAEKKAQMQKQKTPKYLEKKFKIVSAVTGAGGTHLAIALVSYINRIGKEAHYREAVETAFLQRLLACESGVCEEQSICKYRAFKGEIKPMTENEAIQVEDYGTDVESLFESLEQHEIIILILGSQIWQKKESIALYERLKAYPKLIVVCGFGKTLEAKKYAGLLKQEVLCYPLDEDVWKENRKKRFFFRRLLQLCEKNGKEWRDKE